MDALTLLKSDHKTVEALFKRFEKAGDDAVKEKKQIVAEIVKELSIHAAIEEQVFYPAVRKGLKSAEDDVLEAMEEHHIVKWLLSELDGMSPKAERFEAKVTVLMENVRHHVKDEEEELFPKVQKKLGKVVLETLGRALLAAKKVAPTRPHPRAPDTPPGNVVAGIPAAMLDKAKDYVRGMAKRAQTTKNRAKRAASQVASRSDGGVSANGKRKLPAARGRSHAGSSASARAH